MLGENERRPKGDAFDRIIFFFFFNIFIYNNIK